MQLAEQLRMKDITQKTGISKSTVLYYISLGLLPEPMKTSKNMAYYPVSYINIIPVIRYLQGNLHLPLEAIRQIIDHIGFDNISIENALHYYETFLSPLKQGEDVVIYNRKEFENISNLEPHEIRELEDSELLFSLNEGFYSNDDLLAVNAYKRLKDLGIPFSDIKKITSIIKDLTYKVHEIYHENVKELNRKDEQDFTKVMRRELEMIFSYLITKYMVLIYEEEKSDPNQITSNDIDF